MEVFLVQLVSDCAVSTVYPLGGWCLVAVGYPLGAMSYVAGSSLLRGMVGGSQGILGWGARALRVRFLRFSAADVGLVVLFPSQRGHEVVGCRGWW